MPACRPRRPSGTCGSSRARCCRSCSGSTPTCARPHRRRRPAPVRQTAIFGPFFATMLLTFVVWVYMYVRRIRFLTSSKITPAEMAVPGALARLSPPAVANPSDNLKNLFEIPVLFYALVLYLFVTQQVDAVYVTAAWVFVVFRTLHSAVHCTFNHIMLRFYLYLLATLAVWFIAVRAALSYF